jgi:hypothetical protein
VRHRYARDPRDHLNAARTFRTTSRPISFGYDRWAHFGPRLKREY